MGLLDQMFGGGGSKSGGGGMSPLTLALLGILAWQTYNGRGRLADMLGRKADSDAPPTPGQQPPPRGMPDDRIAGRQGDGGLDDLLRQRGGGLGDILSGGGARGGGSGGGGLGDILGSILGGGAGAGRGGGGLGGMLGGMLGGGAAGGAVTGGLGELLRRFQESGRGQVADSWVQTGPNRLVSRQDIEGAIDPEVIDVLARQYGMSRDAVLDNLAHDLPEAVDKLTPEGRLPTREEAERWV
jgi:uncharacterized protein YidB (DUF937 family)